MLLHLLPEFRSHPVPVCNLLQPQTTLEQLRLIDGSMDDGQQLLEVCALDY